MKTKNNAVETERKAERAGHTPGPWMVSANDATEVLNWSRETYQTLKMPVAIRQSLISGLWNPARTAEAAANARLIAAAPELLNALRGFMEAYARDAQQTADMWGEQSLHSSVRAARAAIAAATEGGAP